MANAYLTEWMLEPPRSESASGLLQWSRELGVSPQELRSALATSISMVDEPIVSERRRHAERRHDGRGHRD